MNQMQHDFVGGPVAGQDYSELLGTPFKVVLSNGIEQHLNKATGKVMTQITDLPGLIFCILQARVLHPRKLSGEDLKFIRASLRMRSSEVADVLDVSPEHYSRCEAGTKTLSTAAEKYFRMRVFLQASCKHKAVQEKLAQMEEQKVEFDTEEAKEALAAFQSVFFDMKIAHLVVAGQELAFSFSRGGVRRKARGRGKDDGKWRREQPEKIAA